jgi:hypothetical protein
MKPDNDLTVQEALLFLDPSRTSHHYSMPGPGGRERVRPDGAQMVRTGADVRDAKPRADHVWLSHLDIQLLQRHHGNNSKDHKGSRPQ